MAHDDWNKVGNIGDFKEQKSMVIESKGDSILLVRQGEEVCACGNKCPHYGAPLNEGVITGETVTCPWHTARFNLRTGALEAPPGLDDIPAYDVKIENDEIFLRRRTAAVFPAIGSLDGRVFLIVGGGAAGAAAAETLRREGFSGSIVMVTQEKDLPYDRTVLSKDFVAGKAKPEWLPLRGADFYKMLKIDTRTGRRVVSIDPGRREAKLDDGATIKADAILLATGAEPRRISAPGADLPGCYYLRSLQDGRDVLAAVEKARSVVVIGASFIGLEVASSLRERDITVHVVAPEKVPFDRLLGDRVGRRIRKMHENEGTQFHLETTVSRISGTGRVEAVELSDGTKLPADVVVIGVGVRPVVHYLHDTGLVENGAVPVDRFMRTSAEGIFAAGDIASIQGDGPAQPRMRLEHWSAALRQGIRAAQSMMGNAGAYDIRAFFWTRQCGDSIKYVGFVDRFDEIAYRGDVENGSFISGYFVEGRLRAAASIGGGNELIALGELIADGRAVDKTTFEDSATSFVRLLSGADNSR